MVHERASEVMVSKAAYTAAGGTIILGLTANELAALIGVGIAIATFLMNAWFKWQHLKIARAKAQQEGIELEEA